MGGAMLIDCSVSLLIIRFLAVRLGYGRRLMHALHAALSHGLGTYLFFHGLGYRKYTIFFRINK
jgi:hypothetical protein